MEMKSVKSSNVESIGYDSSTKTMAVKYLNGGLYHYEGVPSEVHENLMASKSIGSTLARSVIGKYMYVHQEKKRGT
jgi:hypothetical protein